jgi:plastocyanin
MLSTMMPMAVEILLGSVHVEMKEFHFGPEVITIKVGTTVQWSNSDNAVHTVVADDGSFHSARMRNGDKFSFTFNRTGTFTYHCGIHALMKGKVVVTPNVQHTKIKVPIIN